MEFNPSPVFGNSLPLFPILLKPPNSGFFNSTSFIPWSLSLSFLLPLFVLLPSALSFSTSFPKSSITPTSSFGLSGLSSISGLEVLSLLGLPGFSVNDI